MAAWGHEFCLRVLKVSLTRERYFQHAKIKFVSPRSHLISSTPHLTSSSLVSNRMGSKLTITPLITKGRPRPRLISNTFDPIAFDTAISPNPSRATIMELKASLNEKERKSQPQLRERTVEDLPLRTRVLTSAT